jgi:hypothetical protein
MTETPDLQHEIEVALNTLTGQSKNAEEAAAVIAVLIRDGWVIPGCPPAKQILSDARQLHEEVVLTKLVARFMRVMILGAVIIPETIATMNWLRDYIDGTHRAHGPLGRPMIWPDRLPTVQQMLREWGFQPTPTHPPYVSLRPGGQMAPLDIGLEPDAPDPRSFPPIDDALELRLSSLLDSFTAGVTCSAVDRTTALRAMAAAHAMAKETMQ